MGVIVAVSSMDMMCFFFWWGLQVGSQSWDVWNISFCLVFSPRDTDISPDDIRYCRVEIL